MKIHDERYKKLKQIGPIPELRSGHSAISFAKNIFDKKNLIKFDLESQLEDVKQTRSDIFRFIEDKNNSTLSCVVLIFSWGGMRQGSLQKELFKSSNNWLPLIDELRKSKFSRYDAFREFQKLRNSSKLDGMGIAYFTKLIYFLGKSNNEQGFILDQWTGKSANFLRIDVEERSRIKFTGNWVNDYNTPEIYENFCLFIKFLSKKLSSDWKKNIHPDQAELCLFSLGRRHVFRREDPSIINKCRAWRSYLIEHY